MVPHVTPRRWVWGAGFCLTPSLLAFLVLTWLTGCAPANREELVKEVLKADPEFVSVLEKHQQLASRIETYEKELALKRTTIQQNIKQLQKELAVAAENARLKMADVKKKMEPDRQRLDVALSMAAKELRERREQRAALGRSIAELRKAAKNPNATATDQEREKLNEMLADAQRLDRERATLTEHVRLIKIKLLLIKL